MKYVVIFLFACYSACTVKQKVITPKVSRIENTGKGYNVWVWYRDSWLVAHFKELPDSIRRGSRITLHPGEPTFKRTGNPTRPW